MDWTVKHTFERNQAVEDREKGWGSAGWIVLRRISTEHGFEDVASLLADSKCIPLQEIAGSTEEDDGSVSSWNQFYNYRRWFAFDAICNTVQQNINN